VISNVRSLREDPGLSVDVPERTWLVRQQIPRLDWSHGIKLPIDVNPRFGKPSWESGAKPYPKDLFRGKRESGPDPGVTEPVFGEGAAGLGTTTRSSASPRLATSTYDLCWSSAPTMCSGRAEKTRPCASGGYILHRAEASSHEIEPSSPSLASSLSCSIASGSPRSLTSRSMQ
jgi:hypothetical protein